MTQTPTLELRFKSENVRIAVYLLFPFFCGVAWTASHFLVIPQMAAGVDKSVVPREKWGCGPFNRKGGEFGLDYGEGFDFNTQSHLQEAFGFPNVCTHWDYDPARQITAVAEAIFEYTLSFYLLLDYLGSYLAYKRGDLRQWYWNVSFFLYPLLIFLGAMFRMVFIAIAYDDTAKHTMGFLCIQIVLMSVAIMNTLQVYLMEKSYPAFGFDKAKTKRLAFRYITGNLFISFFKISATIVIVTTSAGPAWYKYKTGVGDLVWGQVCDFVWMFFNAFLPLVISYVKRSGEDPLVFQITLPRVYQGTKDDSDEEVQLMNK